MPPSAVADESAEALLRRLEWQVLRPLDGVLQGDYRTLAHGRGMDFAEVREYQPDDDARAIDWNVTARMQVPYVRDYFEDREVTVWFLLDRSSSMRFGPETRSKALVLAEVVTVLARLLTSRGNRVAAVLYDNAVERTLPPRGGRGQVLQLAHLLLQPPPARKTATDLAGLVWAGLRMARRRSLVFIVSDFMGRPGWERALPSLCARHDVVAVRLWDPLEVELPDVGLVALEDPETGEQMVVDTGDPRLRERYAAVARGRDEHLGEAFTRAGVDPFTLSTRDELVPALVRMAARRALRRASRAGR